MKGQNDNELNSLYCDCIEKCKDKVIVVANKIDLFSDYNINSFLGQSVIALSAKTRYGIDALELALDNKVRSIMNACTSPFIINVRQHKLLSEVAMDVEKVTSMSEEGMDYELFAYHFRGALEKLSALLGKGVQERVLDEVFATFCVGK